jgi:hypothetical protein
MGKVPQGRSSSFSNPDHLSQAVWRRLVVPPKRSRTILAVTTQTRQLGCKLRCQFGQNAKSPAMPNPEDLRSQLNQ